MSYDKKEMPRRTIQGLLDEKIAYSLREIRDGVVNSGAELEAKLHGRVGWFVNDTLKRLEQHKVRIAFVGQVKAGKSSVINAFMKRPDFLPTDINPSTAVITKIHFGSNEHPANTALFHFFTEQEWDGLFGQLEPRDTNQFTLRSLPNARRTLDVLKQRARDRLGPDYAQFMGRHHLFSAVTPEIMESYVSTGQFSNKDLTLQQKLFSDVTRMAEVFLDENPIFYPSVLIDTPGVNDLFFVRDEITRANLADADVYVLVLTAQQPLSRSDIALLRLLRGLKRDRIIAVINRIDTLTDIETEGSRLKEYVSVTLKRELPHANIPVILTSALWANSALRESPFAIEGLINREFINYASYCGAGDLLTGSHGCDPAEVVSRYGKALFTASGMESLADRINRLIATSIVEEQLLPGSSTLAAISHNSATATRYGMQNLVPNLNATRKGASHSQSLKESALESTERLEKFVNEFEQLLWQLQKNWKIYAEAEIRRLEAYLTDAVERFSNAQAYLLFQDAKHSSFQADLFENTLIFRSDLAELISRHYNDVCRDLFEKQRDGESEIRRVTKKIMPTIDSIMQFGMRPSKSSPVYVIPLAKATVFEVDDFWQHEILSSADPFQKKSDDLKSVIFSAFRPIIKEIVDSANLGLELTIDEIVRHLRVFVVSSLFPVLKQLQQFEDLDKTKPDEIQRAEFLRTFVDDNKKAVEFFENKHKEIIDLKKMCFAV